MSQVSRTVVTQEAATFLGERSLGGFEARAPKRTPLTIHLSTRKAMLLLKCRPTTRFSQGSLPEREWCCRGLCTQRKLRPSTPDSGIGSRIPHAVSRHKLNAVSTPVKNAVLRGRRLYGAVIRVASPLRCDQLPTADSDKVRYKLLKLSTIDSVLFIWQPWTLKESMSYELLTRARISPRVS